MRIEFSETELCGCDTCVQHRTFITQETEPSNVIDGSSLPQVPVSSGPVEALGSSTSYQSSGTETTPLAPSPPVTTSQSVDPEPAQSVDASTTPTSSTSSPVRTSSTTIFSFPPPVSSALRPTGALPGPFVGCSSPFPAPESSISSSRQANIFGSGAEGKVMSISASNSHGHKSHEELRWEDYKNGVKGGFGRLPDAHKSLEELRWEDYKNGVKGGFGWFPAAHTSPFSSPTVSSSLFASPSIPHRRPQMRTVVQPYGNMTGFPFGYNIPTAVQRPYEPTGFSSPAFGCTACGATSSSSPSVHLGLNGTTNPPSVSTSLPGLFLSTYGSCPLLFATPNLAAHGMITTPAVQAYAMILGTNFTSQGTTETPAVQAYPIVFGTPNLSTQGTTTTPAALPYPTMFGTPSLAAQGTTTTPAAQPYPMMFGTPSLAAQGTTTTPAAQPYPTMFGTPSLAAQGTTTTPCQFSL